MTRMFFYCCIVTALQVLRVASHLTIMPPGDTINKSLGSSVVITCSSDLTDHIRWLDTSGNYINSSSTRVIAEAVDSTTQKLIITYIQSSDAGRYTCIGNVSGNLQEKSIRLILFKEITFDEVPEYQHPVIGTNSTIICKVSGSPEPVVWWKFNNARIVPGSKYIQTADGLLVINFTEHDNGLYTCMAEVEGSGMFGMRNINVTVYVLPKITRGIGISETIQGHDFTFTCSAIGMPVPQFKFYYKKDTGQTFEEVKDDKSRILLTPNSLTLRPSLKSDEGSYKCVAENEVGMQQSSPGFLTVFVPAKILEFRDQTINEGESVSMACVAEGNPEAMVEFGRKHNFENFRINSNASGERMKIEKREKNVYQLHIGNIVPEDLGLYYCAARNTHAEDIKYARLTVQYSPRINHLMTSSSMHIWAEISRNLTIYFKSHPIPNASWYLGNHEIKHNATFRMFIGANFSSLEVHVRERDQAWIYGQYRCVLKNIIGQVETSIKLKRATIPDIPVVKVLKSHATDAWLSVEKPEDDGGMPVIGYVVQNQGRIYEFGLDEEIRVHDLKPNTVYLMTVKAKNSVGPGAPKQIRVETKGMSEPTIQLIEDSSRPNRAYELRIFWKVNTTGGMPISDYEFQYRKLFKPPVDDEASDLKTDLAAPSSENYEVDTDWMSVPVKDNMKHPIREFVISNLDPKSSYMVKIKAKNAIGWSAFTEPTTFFTAEASAAEIEMRNSKRTPSLFLIFLVLLISFIVILTAIIDVICCYCCDRGLTKLVYVRCSKISTKPSEKHNSNLLENKALKDPKSSSSKKEESGEKEKFKKRYKGETCEPVPV